MSEDAIADELMKAADDFGMAMTLDDIARLVNTYPDRGLVRAEILDAVAEMKAERDALLSLLIASWGADGEPGFRVGWTPWRERHASLIEAKRAVAKEAGLPDDAFSGFAPKATTEEDEDR